MAEAPSSSFGSLLRDYRLAAGLTQEALAERAGLGVRSIQALERGESRPLRETLRRLADGLGLVDDERGRLLAAGPPAPRKPADRDHAVAESAPDRIQPVTEIPDAISSDGREPPAVWPVRLQAEQAVPLIGRGRELVVLDRHLAGQGPPVLILAGPPGIGKSRLLQEAAERARATGWRVLQGGCTRAGGQQPFAPVLQALQWQIVGCTPEQRRHDLRGCAWLARMLPELAADEIVPLSTWPLPPLQERRLMFDAVQQFLVNVAGRAGTLLVLDDLQWAESDALQLLASMLHRTPSSPVRVIGAYRDTDVEPEHPLLILLAELAERHAALQHRLRPLVQQDAQDLLGRLLGTRTADVLSAHIARRTGGVPFYLVSYASGLEREEAGEEAPGDLPWDLGQSIQRRVLALPEPARELLAVAAVIGRVASRTLLLAVLARSEQDMLEALERACHAGLLEEVGVDSYGFVHDVVREAIEGSLQPARRRLLHRRVAESLEQQRETPPVEALAYHFRQAGEQPRAAVYLEQAGDLAVARYAYAAAAEHYRDLVDCLEGLGRMSDLARAGQKLGQALASTVRFDAQQAALEGVAAALRQAGDLNGLGRIEAQIAGVQVARGATKSGLARLQPIVAQLESHGPSSSLALVYNALAGIYLDDGRYAEALAAAEHAVAAARAAGDDEVLTSIQQSLGSFLLSLNRSDEALQAQEEALRHAEASGDPAALVVPLAILAWIHEERGEYEQDRRCAERALELAERLRHPLLSVWSMVRLGLSSLLTGDWPGAHACLEKAIATTAELGLTEGTWYTACRMDFGRLCTAEGAWEEATRYLEESLTAYAETGNDNLRRVAHGHLAERDILTGEPAAAKARLLPLLDRSGLEERVVTQYVLPMLAWAELELGEVDRAAATAAEAVRRGRVGLCRLGLAHALRVQALAAIAQARWDDAASALEDGLAVARSMPYPHGEGRLLQVYGRLHRARGETAAARARLDAALAIFRRLGASKDVERVEHELLGQ